MRDFLLRMVWSVWLAIFAKLAFGVHPSAAFAIIIIGGAYAAARSLVYRG